MPYTAFFANALPKHQTEKQNRHPPINRQRTPTRILMSSETLLRLRTYFLSRKYPSQLNLFFGLCSINIFVFSCSVFNIDKSCLSRSLASAQFRFSVRELFL